jgi:putative transposase
MTQAVLMALWQREVRSPVILHSDRGCQFTSDEYQRCLKEHNLICSMDDVGSCGDNVAREGFFGLLKRNRSFQDVLPDHVAVRSLGFL